MKATQIAAAYRMDRKGQISVDLIISIIIAMILFVFILNFAESQYKKTEDTIRVLNAKHIAEKLAREINNQYLAGNGAVKYITLPKTLHGGKIYNIRVFPGAVLVDYTVMGERNPSYKTLTSDIYGAQNGLNLNPGRIRISNVNGTIYLENV